MSLFFLFFLYQDHTLAKEDTFQSQVYFNTIFENVVVYVALLHRITAPLRLEAEAY